MPTNISFLKNSIKILHGWLYRLCLPVLVRPPAQLYKGEVHTIARASIIQLLEDWRDRIHGKVLDVGVGTWTLPRQMLQDVCDYTATDYFKLPNVDVVSDIHSLSEVFGRENFDFVICTDVLEHVPRPWIAIRELYAVLKPGGILLLTTPFNFRLHANVTAVPSGTVQDYWRISGDGLRLLLVDEAGFSQVEIKQTGHPKFPFSLIAIAQK